MNVRYSLKVLNLLNYIFKNISVKYIIMHINLHINEKSNIQFDNVIHDIHVY